jgi:hypothetical protein
MHAGADPELPAVVVVFRRPADGQGRLRGSISANAREAVEDEATRETAMLREWVAFDFDAQCAAVVGTGARDGWERQYGDETANCNLP